ncbi:MAG: pyruvate formate lyase family protein [Syntrophales bacterium]|jgi:formate C-acetyltransferase
MLLYPSNKTQARKTSTNILVHVLLHLIAINFNRRGSLKAFLKGSEGWINFSLGIRTDSGSVEVGIIFRDGMVSVTDLIPGDVDVLLTFASDKSIKKLLSATPTEQIFMILKGELRYEGNAAYLNLFFFLLSLLIIKKQKKLMEKERRTDRKNLLRQSPVTRVDLSGELQARRAYRMKAESLDPNVKYLPEPNLSMYSLDDFPRVKNFLDIHFTVKPEICPELPRLVTDWHKAYGFETDRNGKPWNPITRKALAYKYLMENKKPIIRENDLIAGTTTTKEIGVVVYPEGHGTMIWSELLTVPHRSLNPADISEETMKLLHHNVFPYWARRNFREWVRQQYGKPLCQKIDERFAVYFDWKQATISHTIPDFPKIMRLGTAGMIEEIRQELSAGTADEEKATTLEAMILCLEGLTTYSRNLAQQAAKDAAAEHDPMRKEELFKLADICKQVVEYPARTLDEAVNATWITWLALHHESTNAGLSIGRLDQWFQPYFEADMAKWLTDKEREEYIKHAIEMAACFYMRCTDHLPLTPDVANFYFGGSSSDQAITLGGVTPEGADGVCDMTYIFLKVTEMLSIRDPNINARFHPGINSDTYLKRLCEVNLITSATPSMHNDVVMMTSLREMGYTESDMRNWAATGCVEPTLCGKHFGHTNMQMMNMVAPLEMALNNGWHPVMNWKLGPDTGTVEEGAFKTFDDFFEAFTKQFKFLIDQSIEYNHMLGEAHQYIRPTPLLSSLIADCTRKGRDLTKGGAVYNSSGTALIGLADITDSLMVIKKAVFDEKKVTFTNLKKAVDTNFDNDPTLHAYVTNKVPLFGSGSDEAVAMANRVAKWAHEYYDSLPHYRGGKYATGFWSMSNHVIFGNLTNALPSGRRAGKPFTPGLTPQPCASHSLLDNIKDVARLDPKNLNNNIAFNVKVVPSAGDTREKTVNDMFSYVKTYFQLGGMQMQMNVVTSETLRDAMAHPENYRNLLVRISGYNAYFVTLNRDMQLELIERAEYGI